MMIVAITHTTSRHTTSTTTGATTGTINALIVALPVMVVAIGVTTIDLVELIVSV